MREGQVIISVWTCRCAVSRYEANEGGLGIVEATNWQELEDDAVREVEDQDGAINSSGHYTCSSELASKATWSVANEPGAHVER